MPKILYVAPLLDFSGYAEAARNYVRALDIAGMDIVTRDLRYDGGEYKRSEREKELANRSAQDIDIIIQQTTPNETERKDGVFNINAFCWETDRIPKQWVDMLNQMDLILVPIEQNRIAAQKSGVVKPIVVVPYSFNMKKYEKKVEPFVLPGADNSFKFLSILQYSKKKGMDPLLKAYFTEFTREDPVILILKVYMGPNDGIQENNRILSIINAMKGILRLKNYPPIKLIHEVMSHEDIEKLYATADCYALPSRGEGWGVPHFDALGYGLPTIATEHTGPHAFINHECGWLVASNSSPVCDMPHPHEFMYTAVENWREPHVCELKAAMRSAFDLWKHRDVGDWAMWPKMQHAARERVKDFSNEIVGPKLKDAIMKYYEQWKKVN